MEEHAKTPDGLAHAMKLIRRCSHGCRIETLLRMFHHISPLRNVCFLKHGVPSFEHIRNETLMIHSRVNTGSLHSPPAIHRRFLRLDCSRGMTAGRSETRKGSNFRNKDYTKGHPSFVVDYSLPRREGVDGSWGLSFLSWLLSCECGWEHPKGSFRRPELVLGM